MRDLLETTQITTSSCGYDGEYMKWENVICLLCLATAGGIVLGGILATIFGLMIYV